MNELKLLCLKWEGKTVLTKSGTFLMIKLFPSDDQQII